MKYLIIYAGTWCLSVFTLHAQDIPVPDQHEQKQEIGGVAVKVQDGAKPDVYIDGKKYDHSIIELLDPAKIKSINVIKGEKAKEEYNAPNGVIMITSTRETTSEVNDDTEFKIRTTPIESSEDFDTKLRIRGGGKDPLVIIDGKVSTKEQLNKLSPNQIEKIDVLKGEQAIKEHNAVNGVIIITTKK